MSHIDSSAQETIFYSATILEFLRTTHTKLCLSDFKAKELLKRMHAKPPENIILAYPPNKQSFLPGKKII